MLYAGKEIRHLLNSLDLLKQCQKDEKKSFIYRIISLFLFI